MRSGIFPSERLLVTDNTALGLWRTCPRSFYWRVQEGLASKPFGLEAAVLDTVKKDIALSFGTAIHAGLDTYYDTRDVTLAQNSFVSSMDIQNADDDDRVKNRSRGKRLLANYDKYWREFDAGWRLLQNEASFTFDVPDLTIPGSSEPWTLRYHGKIDKILVNDANELQIRDHKTTKFAGSSKIDAYALSNQGMGYLHGLATLLGDDAIDRSSMLFDILVLSPKNDNFHRSAPIRPVPHLRGQFVLGIRRTATMIIDTYLKGQTLDRPHEMFPMHGPDACCNWNRLCFAYSLCESSPDILEDNRKMLYHVDHWDPELR